MRRSIHVRRVNWNWRGNNWRRSTRRVLSLAKGYILTLKSETKPCLALLIVPIFLQDVCSKGVRAGEEHGGGEARGGGGEVEGGQDEGGPGEGEIEKGDGGKLS